MNRPELVWKNGEHEIKMTYGLQMDLQRMVPDASMAISTILTDPFTRDYLVRRALTPVKKSVTNADELVQMEDVDLDYDQVLSLLDWIAEHLLYFFVTSASNLSRHGEELKKAFPQFPPSPTGSPALAS